MCLRLVCVFLLLTINCINLSAQQKKIVLEIFEGTWCSGCPQAIEIIENVLINHPNVIPVALHFGDEDPMNVDAAYQIASIFSGASAPGYMIDRFLFPSEDFVALPVESNVLNNYLTDRINQAPIVKVDLTNGFFSNATRVLSVDVNAEFLQNQSLSIFNMNLYIVESLIQTTDPAYTQAGAGSNYPHKYVLRAMLGGEWGTYGAIDQSTVAPGDDFSYTYLTSIPDDWDVNKLQIIGLVQQSQQLQDFNMRPILNADDVSLSNLISTDIVDIDNEINLQIYPNPTENYIEVNFNPVSPNEYKIQLTDSKGRIIQEYIKYFATGNNFEKFDLSNQANGNYIIKIFNADKSFSRIISKF